MRQHGQVTDPTTRLLVIKATHAADDPERANLAFNVASVGLASGADVHVFLAVEGVRLALDPQHPDALDPDELLVPDAPPIHDLIDALYAGATVTVCAPCAARRGLPIAAFREGTAMGGSTQFLELAMAPGATALVY
jgi:predicted peroxiredoxin